MKTKEEILKPYYNLGSGPGEDSYDEDNILEAMSEYAREAVRELVTYGDDMKILKAWQHDGKIGTATDEDNLQKWMNTL
jgi:hypothetical protein